MLVVDLTRFAQGIALFTIAVCALSYWVGYLVGKADGRASQAAEGKRNADA